MYKYQIYPTLIDAFSWYCKSEAPEANQDMIDKINRVKIEPTDAMLRGVAFEKVIDLPLVDFEPIKVHNISCPNWIVKEFYDEFSGALSQFFVDGVIDTSYGEVRIYGYADKLMRDTVYDVKTTGNYVFPKYLHNWQHVVYLYCLRKFKIDKFVYKITDFKDTFEESYTLTDKMVNNLQEVISRLIEFLIINKSKITDKKIFCV